MLKMPVLLLTILLLLLMATAQDDKRVQGNAAQSDHIISRQNCVQQNGVCNEAKNLSCCETSSGLTCSATGQNDRNPTCQVRHGRDE
nr:new putative conotoxin precursor Virro01 [Conus ebraeus]UMA82977.1 new putative conotoxin precursor Virro01 [Conus ebraeus]DAZ86100.1 TPA_inf: conotoxin precursor Virro01 [Conus ebraeus]